MALRMNPFTGKPEFIEDTPVINEQTGQRANTAGQTAVAAVAPDVPVPTELPPAPVLQTPVAPFEITPDRNQEVTRADEARTTGDTFSFLEDLQRQAQAVQDFEFTTPAIRTQQQLLNNLAVQQGAITTGRLQSASDVLQAQAQAENRLVDIGTIQGQQDAISRAADFADRDAQIQAAAIGLQQESASRILNTLLDQQALEFDKLKFQFDAGQQLFDRFVVASELVKEAGANDPISATRQAAILGAIAQGVTDPAGIFQAINFDETGQLTGDISLAEINDVLGFVGGEQDSISALDRAKLNIDQQRLGLDFQKEQFDQQIAIRELELEEFERQLETQEKDTDARNAAVTMVSTINNILGDPNLVNVVGGIATRNINTKETAQVRGAIAQLKALTALEGREKLEGTGPISDFEAGMLADSANSVNFSIGNNGGVAMNLSDFTQDMKNLRGLQQLKTGQPVTVIITDPGTGQSEERDVNAPSQLQSSLVPPLTRDDLNDAYLQGFLIDFK